MPFLLSQDVFVARLGDVFDDDSQCPRDRKHSEEGGRPEGTRAHNDPSSEVSEAEGGTQLQGLPSVPELGRSSEDE